MEDFINRVYTISAMESFGVISTQRVINGLAPLNVFSGSTAGATTAVTTAATTTAGAAAAAAAGTAEIDLTSDNEQPDNSSSSAMTVPLSAVNAAAAAAATLNAGTVLDLNASSYYENGFDFEEPEIMEVEDAETEPTALEVAQAELAAQQAAAHNAFTAYMQAVNSGAAKIADAGAAAAATAAAAASAAAAAGTKRARSKQAAAKRSSSGDTTGAAPAAEPSSKRRKSDTAALRKNAKEPLEEHVRCCIECEEEGELAMCTKCPRVYHFHCLLRIDERCSELTDITQLPDPWYCPRVSAY
jgi:hypothetical protein